MSFLIEKAYIYDKLKAGVDHHASDAEYTEFKRLADLISPKNKFEWRGCHSCGQALMKFVFNNADKLEEKTKKPNPPATNFITEGIKPHQETKK